MDDHSSSPAITGSPHGTVPRDGEPPTSGEPPHFDALNDSVATPLGFERTTPAADNKVVAPSRGPASLDGTAASEQRSNGASPSYDAEGVDSAANASLLRTVPTLRAAATAATILARAETAMKAALVANIPGPGLPPSPRSGEHVSDPRDAGRSGAARTSPGVMVGPLVTTGLTRFPSPSAPSFVLEVPTPSQPPPPPASLRGDATSPPTLPLPLPVPTSLSGASLSGTFLSGGPLSPSGVSAASLGWTTAAYSPQATSPPPAPSPPPRPRGPAQLFTLRPPPAPALPGTDLPALGGSSPPANTPTAYATQNKTASPPSALAKPPTSPASRTAASCLSPRLMIDATTRSDAVLVATPHTGSNASRGSGAEVVATAVLTQVTKPVGTRAPPHHTSSTPGTSPGYLPATHRSPPLSPPRYPLPPATAIASQQLRTLSPPALFSLPIPHRAETTRPAALTPPPPHSSDSLALPARTDATPGALAAPQAPSWARPERPDALIRSTGSPPLPRPPRHRSTWRSSASEPGEVTITRATDSAPAPRHVASSPELPLGCVITGKTNPAESTTAEVSLPAGVSSAADGTASALHAHCAAGENTMGAVPTVAAAATAVEAADRSHRRVGGGAMRMLRREARSCTSSVGGSTTASTKQPPPEVGTSHSSRPGTHSHRHRHSKSSLVPAPTEEWAEVSDSGSSPLRVPRASPPALSAPLVKHELLPDAAATVTPLSPPQAVLTRKLWPLLRGLFAMLPDTDLTSGEESVSPVAEEVKKAVGSLALPAATAVPAPASTAQVPAASSGGVTAQAGLPDRCSLAASAASDTAECTVRTRNDSEGTGELFRPRRRHKSRRIIESSGDERLAPGGKATQPAEFKPDDDTSILQVAEHKSSNDGMAGVSSSTPGSRAQPQQLTGPPATTRTEGENSTSTLPAKSAEPRTTEAGIPIPPLPSPADATAASTSAVSASSAGHAGSEGDRVGTSSNSAANNDDTELPALLANAEDTNAGMPWRLGPGEIPAASPPPSPRPFARTPTPLGMCGAPGARAKHAPLFVHSPSYLAAPAVATTTSVQATPSKSAVPTHHPRPPRPPTAPTTPPATVAAAATTVTASNSPVTSPSSRDAVPSFANPLDVAPSVDISSAAFDTKTTPKDSNPALANEGTAAVVDALPDVLPSPSEAGHVTAKHATPPEPSGQQQCVAALTPPPAQGLSKASEIGADPPGLSLAARVPVPKDGHPVPPPTPSPPEPAGAGQSVPQPDASPGILFAVDDAATARALLPPGARWVLAGREESSSESGSKVITGEGGDSGGGSAGERSSLDSCGRSEQVGAKLSSAGSNIPADRAAVRAASATPENDALTPTQYGRRGAPSQRSPARTPTLAPPAAVVLSPSGDPASFFANPLVAALRHASLSAETATPPESKVAGMSPASPTRCSPLAMAGRVDPTPASAAQLPPRRVPPIPPPPRLATPPPPGGGADGDGGTNAGAPTGLPSSSTHSSPLAPQTATPPSQQYASVHDTPPSAGRLPSPPPHPGKEHEALFPPAREATFSASAPDPVVTSASPPSRAAAPSVPAASLEVSATPPHTPCAGSGCTPAGLDTTTGTPCASPATAHPDAVDATPSFSGSCTKKPTRPPPSPPPPPLLPCVAQASPPVHAQSFPPPPPQPPPPPTPPPSLQPPDCPPSEGVQVQRHHGAAFEGYRPPPPPPPSSLLPPQLPPTRSPRAAAGLPAAQEETALPISPLFLALATPASPGHSVIRRTPRQPPFSLAPISPRQPAAPPPPHPPPRPPDLSRKPPPLSPTSYQQSRVHAASFPVASRESVLAHSTVPVTATHTDQGNVGSSARASPAPTPTPIPAYASTPVVPDALASPELSSSSHRRRRGLLIPVRCGTLPVSCYPTSPRSDECVTGTTSGARNIDLRCIEDPPLNRSPHAHPDTTSEGVHRQTHLVGIADGVTARRDMEVGITRPWPVVQPPQDRRTCAGEAAAWESTEGASAQRWQEQPRQLPDRQQQHQLGPQPLQCSAAGVQQRGVFAPFDCHPPQPPHASAPAGPPAPSPQPSPIPSPATSLALSMSPPASVPLGRLRRKPELPRPAGAETGAAEEQLPMSPLPGGNCEPPLPPPRPTTASSFTVTVHQDAVPGLAAVDVGSITSAVVVPAAVSAGSAQTAAPSCFTACSASAPPSPPVSPPHPSPSPSSAPCPAALQLPFAKRPPLSSVSEVPLLAPHHLPPPPSPTTSATFSSGSVAPPPQLPRRTAAAAAVPLPLFTPSQGGSPPRVSAAVGTGAADLSAVLFAEGERLRDEVSALLRACEAEWPSVTTPQLPQPAAQLAWRIEAAITYGGSGAGGISGGSGVGKGIGDCGTSNASSGNATKRRSPRGYATVADSARHVAPTVCSGEHCWRDKLGSASWPGRGSGRRLIVRPLSGDDAISRSSMRHHRLWPRRGPPQHPHRSFVHHRHSLWPSRPPALPSVYLQVLNTPLSPQ